MKPPDAHWLNEKRLRVYPRVLLLFVASMCLYWMLGSKQMVDRAGYPLGYDFITFWAASLAGLQGHAQDAYKAARLFPYEQIAVPASQKIFGWFYPPGFYLLILPLAKMPYFVAYMVWAVATLGLYVAVLRRTIRGSTAMWCLAAFPGVWINFLDGQNAFLTAAFAGAAMLCLKRRPAAAGVCVGLLAVKPHLAVLFVVGLLAVRAWRSLMAAAATALALTAAGVAVLGKGTLRAWMDSLATARLLLEMGGLSWEKMPTTFAMARLCRAPLSVAYGLQAVVAAGAIAAVWLIWRRSPDWKLRGASLMTATFLISPYVFDYDLAWLAFPIAWMCVKGREEGWLRGEREVLVAAWTLPLISTPIASAIHVQCGPFVCGVLVWMMYRRTELERRGSTGMQAGARSINAN